MDRLMALAGKAASWALKYKHLLATAWIFLLISVIEIQGLRHWHENFSGWSFLMVMLNLMVGILLTVLAALILMAAFDKKRP